jgi:hypothetical protein
VKNLIYQVKKKLPSAAKACVRDTVATVSTIFFKACGEVKLSKYLVIRGPPHLNAIWEEEDVRSYWMALRTGEDTLI